MVRRITASPCDCSDCRSHPRMKRVQPACAAAALVLSMVSFAGCGGDSSSGWEIPSAAESGSVYTMSRQDGNDALQRRDPRTLKAIGPVLDLPSSVVDVE